MLGVHSSTLIRLHHMGGMHITGIGVECLVVVMRFLHFNG